MKILLVGEYSRLHNSLKEGLQALGHEVTLIATGDSFKNYPADIKLERHYQSGFTKKIKVALFKLTGIDLAAISLKNQFFAHQEQLTGFDVVQLINESSFTVTPKVEKEIVSFLKKNNKKLFLLSCGTDHITVSHALSNALPYSILSGYKDGTVAKEKYKFILKYVSAPFRALHEFIYKQVDGVIASDMDYHLALKGHLKYRGLIPNPVNIVKLNYSEVASETPIVIFMGINNSNRHTKGIAYFEKALEIIQKKYSEKIKIEIVENKPYAEYIKIYDKAHILLDQVLSYDQGYNALEAMAKGKVVFTGAGEQFKSFYNVNEIVAIDAVPDVSKIVEALEDLILNPKKIAEIGKNARAFVEREHNYIAIAEKYLDAWTR